MRFDITYILVNETIENDVFCVGGNNISSVYMWVEIIYHQYRHLHLLHISWLTTPPYPRCITQTCASPCSTLSLLIYPPLIQGKQASIISSKKCRHGPPYSRELEGKLHTRMECFEILMMSTPPLSC